jgi:phage recombination protein Bet
MTTALAVQDSQDYSREKVELIKRTICSGATDDELALFLYTAKRTGLDPLARQIHAVKRWNAAAGREVMAIQTAIDGYRLIADRTGKLAGISDPVYDTESSAFPGKATVVVGKMVDGMVQEFTASARWSEYVQNKKDGTPNSMWARMPYLMLGKCAEALALRKAFPVDLSGVYTEEEMGQAWNEAPAKTIIGTASLPQEEGQGKARPAEPQIQRKSQKNAAPTQQELPAQQAEPAPAKLTAEQREEAWKSTNGHDPDEHISVKQGGLLFVIKGKLKLSDDDLHDTMRDCFGVDHYNTIKKADFAKLLDTIDPDKLHHNDK